MKILFVHNFYQIAGGEDAVYKNEMDLLKENGNEVIEYTVDNASIISLCDKIGVMFSTIFSFSQYKKIKRVLKDNSPDVVHVHNYFPLISPAVFYACKKMNVPVVHTLHNYRAVCPTALLMHDGKVCEKSIKYSAWWAVKNKVYRDSLIGSFILTCMVEFHKKLGTWQKQVNCFIALTQFAKNKYIEAGWPKHKISIKPNFIEDPFKGEVTINKQGGYAIYVGRLSDEKGIDLILKAWENVDFPLKVIGAGPLQEIVESSKCSNIEYLGLQQKEDVLNLVKNADFMVMASTWYEGFPMVLVEAMACGTCSLVPNLGSMAEVIQDHKSGLHFVGGNLDDFMNKVNCLVNNPDKTKVMGNNAREIYLKQYTADKNYHLLYEIYQQSLLGNDKNG
jgi:glycosyltransferase involved in cell wall biosynthesis